MHYSFRQRFVFKSVAIISSRYEANTLRKETLTSVHCTCKNWMMAIYSISGYPCRDKFPTAATYKTRRQWRRRIFMVFTLFHCQIKAQHCFMARISENGQSVLSAWVPKRRGKVCEQNQCTPGTPLSINFLTRATREIT
jgi:hypothetical protein